MTPESSRAATLSATVARWRFNLSALRAAVGEAPAPATAHNGDGGPGTLGPDGRRREAGGAAAARPVTAVGATNGHADSAIGAAPPQSLALAGVPDFGALLEHSDKRTRTILKLRRRAAASKRRGFLVARMLLLADVLGLVLAFALAHMLVPSTSDSGDVTPIGEIAVFAATLPVWTLAAKVYGLYDNDDERTDHSTADDLVGVFHLVSVGTWTLLLASGVTGWGEFELGRLFAFWGLAVVGIAAGRGCARAFCRRRITYLQNAVIVGAGDVGQFIARKLLQHPEYGVNLLGFVDSDPKSLREDLEGLRVLGRPEDLAALVRLFDVERVIFAFSRLSGRLTQDLVQATKELDVQVDIVPRLYEAVGPSASIHTVEGVPLMSLPPVGPNRSSLLVKRLIDLVVTSLGLLLLAPLLATIAVAVKLDSEGPAFYRHERLGRNGRRLRLFKFRTMHLGSCRGEGYGGDAAEREFRGLMEDDARRREFELSYKLRDDPRVTRLGTWLRSTSLDELPQLFNVLRGEMSLVGPRPITADEIAKYEPKASAILAVKPGLTGYWQINGRSGLDYEDRVRLDSAYVGSWSLKLDLKILAKTLRTLLSRTGAF